jgi:hypothetical protein
MLRKFVLWTLTILLPGLCLAAAIFLFSDRLYGAQGSMVVAWKAGLLLGIFVLLGIPYSIVHELGHAIIGRYFGVPVRSIRIGSRKLWRIGKWKGIVVLLSPFPFGGRVEFELLPLDVRKRIAMFAAGVGAATLTAALVSALLPLSLLWLRTEIVIARALCCFIDLFGKAPEGARSDSDAIRGLLKYARRSGPGSRARTRDA